MGPARPAARFYEEPAPPAGAAELLDRTIADLGLADAPGGPGLRSRVDALSDLVLVRLRSTGALDEALHLGALFAQLQQLAGEEDDRRLRQHRLRVARAELGLAGLRALTTADALIDEVCDAAAESCDFESVLLSDVTDGLWSPWKVNTASRDATWWTRRDAGSIPVSDVPFEAALLSRHRPALVTDTSRAGVHPLVGESGASSYVAAPIATRGRIVGFLHAGRGRGWECDVTDRDVLWLFAEGFAHIYERTALLDGLRERRASVRRALGAVDRAMTRLTESELELAIAPDAAEPVALTAISAARRDAESQLTAREIEVLEQVGTGARNSAIAAALGITEATVKSHVKHILVKLGATNRTQAIAYAREAVAATDT